MNKTLLGLVLGVISLSPLAFASADSLSNGLSSNSNIISISSDIRNGEFNKCFIADDESDNYTFDNYTCFVVSPSNSVNDISISNGLFVSYNNGSVFCSNTTDSVDAIFLTDEISSCNIYYSSSPITWADNSSSDSSDDNSSIIPTIPSSFTSGLTSIVNNFGSIIVNWLPTIILISLGIYAIFALFRVVRNYAKSSFNG